MSTETQRKRQHAIDLLLKSLFEKMPTISSFFYSLQVSPSHVELMAPYLPTLGVFLLISSVSGVCPGVAEAAFSGFSCIGKAEL